MQVFAYLIISLLASIAGAICGIGGGVIIKPLLDVTGLDLVGATLDPGCLLGTVGYSKPPKYVLVGGKVVAQEGHLLGIDEARTAEAARTEMLAMLAAGKAL